MEKILLLVAVIISSKIALSNELKIEDFVSKNDYSKKQIEFNKDFIKLLTHGSRVSHFEVIQDFSFDGEVFKRGDSFSWSRDGYLLSVKLAETRIWQKITLMGQNEFSDVYSKERTRIDFHKNSIKPRFGILGRDIVTENLKYEKWRFACFDYNGSVLKYYPFDVRKLTPHILALHDDGCTIERLSLSEDVSIEGVTWLKGTSLEFDESFKWHFIRMRPGQEFQGKVYKDGGVLLRGDYNKYQKNHGPEDIRILTPDMEGYPH